ncbi:MAG: 7-carboxy-7-deazaguanine synthase QueE [Vulcanimicrobiaceae bacterium]
MLQLAEIFYSLQGEGTHAGTPAVFVRLAGCNLACDFCDTDYALKFIASIDDVVTHVREIGGECPMVVITGGEPFAQRETLALIGALRADGRRVHVESNGTIPVGADLPSDVWLTVSPKERLDSGMAQRANEAKLIVDRRVPREWTVRFGEHTPIFLQPEGNKPENVALAVEAAKAEPALFRLSLQTHKYIGIR